MASTTISPKKVAELRGRTGAGMMDCKRALEETDGDVSKAVERLRQKGAAKADKRSGRSTSEGVVEAYLHFNNKVGVLVELNSETDFVARTDDFRQLAKELALHIASANPVALQTEDVPKETVEQERRVFEAQAAEQDKPEHIREKIVKGKLRQFFQQHVLMEQKFIKDDSKAITDLVKETSAKVGENIVVRRFARFELGQ